jgi:predicted TIM-barrel fold metal-dependent hydrolase
MHFGSGGMPPATSPEAPFAVMVTLMGTTSMAAAVELVFSPVFHKHPNLKVAFSEGGIGWMPYLTERADYVWRKHKYYQNIHPDVPPSEFFRRNISGCFIEDEVGVALRDKIGIDNITWECDYPHSDSFWPKSRARAEEMLASVPDEEAHKIVELNARRWYAFPEAGFKSATADKGWRPNGGQPSDYDYDKVMAEHGGINNEQFVDNLAQQMTNKE